LATALGSPRSCVTPYPVQVAQGMLWVLPVSALDAPARADWPPLPLIPELEDPDCVVQDIFRDLPMDYGTLLVGLALPPGGRLLTWTVPVPAAIS
jgi:phenylpropionate dioxygenase-like ring-hydroxylating dioxygenase large terminal subunit